MNQNVTTDLQSAKSLFTSLQIAKAVNGQKFTMPELSLNSSMFSWKTEDDEKVCHTCEQKGQTIYTMTGVATLQPAHPNCRCEVVPLVGIRANTLTSIAPNYLSQKNSGIAVGFRDTINTTKDKNWFIYDNAEKRLPCETNRTWIAQPAGTYDGWFTLTTSDILSFLTPDNFKSFFAITGDGKDTTFDESIMNPQKELELLQNGEIAPMAYTYVMRLVYDWYLTDVIEDKIAIQNALVDFRATGYTKTGIDFYDEGIAAMPKMPTEPITQEEHYFRNKLNIELEWKKFEKLNERLPEELQWSQMSEDKSIYHQNTASASGKNKKFVSGCGYFELVFSYDNQLLNAETASIDMGTYNYCPSGVDATGHFTMDMVTYYIWKNTLEDFIEDRLISTRSHDIPGGLYGEY
ncbi:hypothetical protein [Chakrabartyella piscis]|uniref:hypothetical protein n=1 Tax=Chakrabartyella piscis TaxID=2918914 RepID=UPI0029586E0D|nr:hypothetical protein [Chakrabartyella piscis]